MKPPALHATSDLTVDANPPFSPTVLSGPYRAVRVSGAARDGLLEEVAIEEPLQIRLAGEDVAVLMRTPGHDAELVAGYLYSEGIIRGPEDVAEMRPCAGDAEDPDNVINVLPADRALLRPADWGRLSEGYSSCGICGKSSIKQVMRSVPALTSSLRVDESVLFDLSAKIKCAQPAFQQTGGLHAAGLFDTDGNLLALREDVGRHNAVDKVIGSALLAGLLPLSDSILAVTSRASFEIVQKAANAGVPILAVMSAPSSLAIELARECGMALVAFLRAGRFNIYSGEARIASNGGSAASDQATEQ